MADDRPQKPARPPAIQLRLQTLFWITAAVAVLFGTLRWLGVSPRASAIVLVILSVSVAAAVGLLVVIAASAGNSPGNEDGEHDNSPSGKGPG